MKKITSETPFMERLAEGKPFEEAVSRFLTANGFPINLYLTAQGQQCFGESGAHVEIKLDQICRTSRRLFIETKERRHVGIGNMRPAGIYDASDPWFYCIGDWTKLWLIPVSLLREYHLTVQAWQIVVTATSEGFFLHLKVADGMAIKVWPDWNAQTLFSSNEWSALLKPNGLGNPNFKPNRTSKISRIWPD